MHKNGCNILIMTLTNLEKYVYSKKCVKRGRQPPTPPSIKVEGISRAGKVTWLRLLFWADLHLFQTGFGIGWKNNRDGDITMS